MNLIINCTNNTLLNDELLEPIINKLSIQDKEKYNRISNERKKRFLTARYLLNNINVDISKITYSTLGKPLLEKNYISISHTDSYTVVSFSDQEIGIDIEEIKDVDKITKEYFLGKDCSNEEFFKEFTKTEAYIKFFSLGLANIKDNKDILNYDYQIIDNHILCVAYKK